MRKRIAFVDYNLENFHANKYLELLRGDVAGRGFEVSVCTGMQKNECKEWARKNNVPYVDEIQDIADNCDYIMVLAPSNPEVHLELAEQVLPLKKVTYIDKTFAPDTKTAEKIFALADQHRVPVTTSSALRYTDEVHGYADKVGRANIRHMQAWGPGRTFEEYGIHPTEMVISVMGPEVEKVMVVTPEPHVHLVLLLSGGRTADIFVYTGGYACPYAAMLTTHKETSYQAVNAGTIFKNQVNAILDFFETGKENIDRRETLVIRRILDCGTDPAARQVFVEL